MIDAKNSYKSHGPYLAYCRNTDEKKMLHGCIGDQITHPYTILDIGSGNGINTLFLGRQFPHASVDGVERSEAQFEFARKNRARRNITYHLRPFEEFESQTSYDFALASHVLQYIDSDVSEFVGRAVSSVNPNGTLWVVQQTRTGIQQIIAHQKPYLVSERFKDWQTIEDYEPLIRETLGEGYGIETETLDSSITKINFSNPSKVDKLRLEFIFCLDEPFDAQTAGFKEHLASIEPLEIEGRIPHENRILKITPRSLVH